MSIKVTNDANNGTVTIKGAEVAGDYTVTTPAFATELAPRMQLMTAQNSTSGTSIDFTGIPSWAKKITVMFNVVSTNGTSPVQIQLGNSGGIEITGYVSTVSTAGGTTQSSTTGLLVGGISAASSRNGIATIVNISANQFAMNSLVSTETNQLSLGAGSKQLSSTLDRIRITTVNGTDTFDSGQINVLYEG